VQAARRARSRRRAPRYRAHHARPGDRLAFGKSRAHGLRLARL